MYNQSMLVAVLGSGSRAAEWITRYLASGLDVAVDDAATVRDEVATRWPASDRLGLIPGSSIDRLRTRGDGDLNAARLVHRIGAASEEPHVVGADGPLIA